MIHKRNILGINVSHNGAVCLLKDGKITAAIQEERLARIKGKRITVYEKPLGIDYCLNVGQITVEQIDLVVLCVLRCTPNDIALFRAQLNDRWSNIPIITVSHHLAHAISAFRTSGFNESAVLVVDGVGSAVQELSVEEQKSILPNGILEGEEIISLYHAIGRKLQPLEKTVAAPLGHTDQWLEGREEMVAGKRSMPIYNSLGGLFSAVSTQIFNNINNAGKVMGLAPFGKPVIPTNDFLQVKKGKILFQKEVCNSFYDTRPWPANATYYCNLAASAQAALDHAMLNLVRRIKKLSKSDNLCLTGGVALNGITNQKIFRSKVFKKIHILPASDDSGIAIGAAYFGHLQFSTKKKNTDSYTSDFWGKTYTDKDIERALCNFPGIVYRQLSKSAILHETSNSLLQGEAVGWFRGRSEFGPRALGNRSILMDPRIPNAHEHLNIIKGREPFRPFAPAILMEKAADWFELNGTEPENNFMMRIVRFKPSKATLVPAVAHVDCTGRYQTVTAKNGLFYSLIRQFDERTGIPILLNTSFNILDQPIVESPDDALICFLFSKLNALAIGNFFVQRQSTMLATSLSFKLSSNGIYHPSKNILKRNHLRGKYSNYEVITKHGLIIAKLSKIEESILQRLNNGGEIVGLATQKEGICCLHQENSPITQLAYQKALYKLCSMGLISIIERSSIG